MLGFGLSFLLMAGCGSGDAERARAWRMHASHERSREMVEADSFARAVRYLWAVLPLDSASLTPRQRPGTQADTLHARMRMRLGYAEWRLGNRTRALHAYGALWLHGAPRLPDSLAAEAMRSAAYVAADTTGVPDSLKARHLAGAYRIMRGAAERAVAAGQNGVASDAYACLAWITGASDGPLASACGPAGCEAPRDPSRGLAWLLVALVALVAALLALADMRVKGWRAARHHRILSRMN